MYIGATHPRPSVFLTTSVTVSKNQVRSKEFHDHRGGQLNAKSWLQSCCCDNTRVEKMTKATADNGRRNMQNQQGCSKDVSIKGIEGVGAFALTNTRPYHQWFQHLLKESKKGLALLVVQDVVRNELLPIGGDRFVLLVLVVPPRVLVVHNTRHCRQISLAALAHKGLQVVAVLQKGFDDDLQHVACTRGLQRRQLANYLPNTSDHIRGIVGDNTCKDTSLGRQLNRNTFCKELHRICRLDRKLCNRPQPGSSAKADSHVDCAQPVGSTVKGQREELTFHCCEKILFEVARMFFRGGCKRSSVQFTLQYTLPQTIFNHRELLEVSCAVLNNLSRRRFVTLRFATGRCGIKFRPGRLPSPLFRESRVELLTPRQV
jgi:hypothetical protein